MYADYQHGAHAPNQAAPEAAPLNDETPGLAGTEGFKGTTRRDGSDFAAVTTHWQESSEDLTDAWAKAASAGRKPTLDHGGLGGDLLPLCSGMCSIVPGPLGQAVSLVQSLAGGRHDR